MKTLIIYYSLEGNTDFVAREMADEIGADLLRLKPQKDYNRKGAGKYFSGGSSVLFGKKPVLEKLLLDPADYGLLFIGTPVWAGSYSPPLRTFFSTADLKDKSAAFFCCHGGGKGKALEKMEKALECKEILGKADFEDPMKKDTEEAAAKARKWAKEIFEKAVKA